MPLYDLGRVLNHFHDVYPRQLVNACAVYRMATETIPSATNSPFISLSMTIQVGTLKQPTALDTPGRT